MATKRSVCGLSPRIRIGYYVNANERTFFKNVIKRSAAYLQWSRVESTVPAACLSTLRLKLALRPSKCHPVSQGSPSTVLACRRHDNNDTDRTSSARARLLPSRPLSPLLYHRRSTNWPCVCVALWLSRMSHRASERARDMLLLGRPQRVSFPVWAGLLQELP